MHVNPYLQGFLVQLRQDDDEAAQLDALSQLNELLSISSEESLSVFPVEQLVPVLVRSQRPSFVQNTFVGLSCRMHVAGHNSASVCQRCAQPVLNH